MLLVVYTGREECGYANEGRVWSRQMWRGVYKRGIVEIGFRLDVCVRVLDSFLIIFVV